MDEKIDIDDLIQQIVSDVAAIAAHEFRELMEFFETKLKTLEAEIKEIKEGM